MFFIRIKVFFITFKKASVENKGFLLSIVTKCDLFTAFWFTSMCFSTVVRYRLAINTLCFSKFNTISVSTGFFLTSASVTETLLYYESELGLRLLTWNTTLLISPSICLSPDWVVITSELWPWQIKLWRRPLPADDQNGIIIE